VADLALRFCTYIETKRVAGGGSSKDLTTAVMIDQPTLRNTQRLASKPITDMNTVYNEGIA
jgi:hypothetical protein